MDPWVPPKQQHLRLVHPPFTLPPLITCVKDPPPPHSHLRPPQIVCAPAAGSLYTASGCKSVFNTGRAPRASSAPHTIHHTLPSPNLFQCWCLSAPRWLWCHQIQLQTQKHFDAADSKLAPGLKGEREGEREREREGERGTEREGKEREWGKWGQKHNNNNNEEDGAQQQNINEVHVWKVCECVRVLCVHVHVSTLAKKVFAQLPPLSL